MARKKSNSNKKQQLGQFMTPDNLSKDILDNITFNKTDKVLEPSFGDGSFLIKLIHKFIPLYKSGTIQDKLEWILSYNIWGYEIDELMFDDCVDKIIEEWGYIPKSNNLHCQDFLTSELKVEFDWIIGNPPFGGTISPEYDRDFERLYGRRNNEKIKKETYSYFIVKCVELLSEDGKLVFICSDTFKTIKTMEGLRKWLMTIGFINIYDIGSFSDETKYSMLAFEFINNKIESHIIVNNNIIPYDSIYSTPNTSWSINEELSSFFGGELLGHYIVCSGGLTTGKNEYFIKDLDTSTIPFTLIEEYKYTYYDDMITLHNELMRAKNNILSKEKIREIKKAEERGDTIIDVDIQKVEPKTIQLPHPDYCYYNVSSPDILWCNPTKAIYWDDDGIAVRTFKRNGNWYLQGMGGQKFYKKEGMTWQLIANKIRPRYIPEGYIIDNGSPIAILREGVDDMELYFIIGWCLSNKCNDILKMVINHTRNIQNKDIEKLPYPTWVGQSDKIFISKFIKDKISDKKRGVQIDEDQVIEVINRMF